VTKVESSRRPDGARGGPAAFFELLHAGHQQLTLDFDHDRHRLADLVMAADLVLEASRPRALRQLGLIAEDVVAAGTSWLSITAHGRDSDAVGFGDDVAARAGLVVHDGGRPMPAGDAIADPLTGLAAATAATEALASPEAQLIDVSMLHVTAATLGQPTPAHQLQLRADGWWVECDAGAARVEEPRPRPRANLPPSATGGSAHSPGRFGRVAAGGPPTRARVR
jgi:crotonobetainyl-CoA:carnitine CoA-transferase CaiB-like acyl-CoA transferase